MKNRANCFEIVTIWAQIREFLQIFGTERIEKFLLQNWEWELKIRGVLNEHGGALSFSRKLLSAAEMNLTKIYCTVQSSILVFRS